MTRPTRRGFLIGGVPFAIAGCLGPELGYDDETPFPADENDAPFGSAELQRIIDFAEDSMAAIEEATDALQSWRRDADAIPLDDVDQLRIRATALLSTYWNRVVPYEDALTDLDAGESVNGVQWDGNGEALVSVFRDHETALHAIEEASIGIVNAEGDPDRISSMTNEAIDFIIEESREIIEDTRVAIGD